MVNEMFNISYSYNKDGIRTKKIVNNVETDYFVDNLNIVFEKTNNNVTFYAFTSAFL